MITQWDYSMITQWDNTTRYAWERRLPSSTWTSFKEPARRDKNLLRSAIFVTRYCRPVIKMRQ